MMFFRFMVAAAAVALLSTCQGGAAYAAEVNMSTIYANTRPSDIELPPEKTRSTTGVVNVQFSRTIVDKCRTNDGMITLACTLYGKINGTPMVVTVLPDPCMFPHETVARSACNAYRKGFFPAIIYHIRRSCSFPKQIWARLSCHEVIGHQLGRYRHAATRTQAAVHP